MKKMILLMILYLSLATGTAFAQQYGGGSGTESDPFLISSNAYMEEPAENITLETAPSTLNFTAASETKSVTITSNVSWTVDKDVAWITVTPDLGNNNGTIIVTAAANTATSPRTGTVTVSGGDIDRTISITQAAYVPPTNTLTVSTETLDFTAGAESKSVTITSNVNWTIDSDSEWIGVFPASGKDNAAINVGVAANKTASQRTGTVTVSGGGINRTISITQAIDAAFAQNYGGGSGTESDPFLISSNAHIEELARIVNGGYMTYAGDHFKLTTDLTRITTVIGTKDLPFRGVFDGDGHTIVISVRLFGYLDGATIKNTKVSEINFINNASGICGNANNSTIDNCYYTGKISASPYAGGICGNANNSTISNCYYTGNISTASDYHSYAGGICGNANNSIISNCYYTGSISAHSYSSSSPPYAGGICGNANNSTISNCYNAGKISATSVTAYAGGICGSGGTIINCYNMGNISASSYAGGICGSGSTIINCYNMGNISASASAASYAGGICGGAVDNNMTTISNCYNTGNISAAYAGGICGYIRYAKTISNCYNTGKISASASYYSSYAGGICGSAVDNNMITISNCYNTGNISATSSYATSYAGGICGYGYSTISNCFAANATITGRYAERIVGYNNNSNNAGGRISNCHALISMEINGRKKSSINTDSKDGADGEDANFKDESWLTSVLTWDFGSVWMISGRSEWPALKSLDEYISMEIVPPTLSFTAIGETKPFTITSNVSWTVDMDAAWITVSPASGRNSDTVNVTAEVNITASQRTGTVTISGEGLSRTVSITQAAGVVHEHNYGGGNGTPGDPFLISSRTHMEELATIVNGGTTYAGYHFKLTTDLTGITTVIGKEKLPFRGVFDGDGHMIELNINTTGNYAGVFGYISGTTVKNMKVSGKVILTYSSRTEVSAYAGGICGYANNSTVSDCYNTGSISASNTAAFYTHSYAGGICGYANNSTIINCYNTRNIFSDASSLPNSISYSYAGGICGSGGNVSSCYNTGNISADSYSPYGYTNSSRSADSYAGGICGSDGNVSNCYNTGNITASATNASSAFYTSISVGGICGGVENDNGITISNCYNTGNISPGSISASSIGGICGKANNITISNCFAANATITGSSSSGRIVGYSVNISNCHALTSMKINGQERHSTDAGSKDGADGEEADFKNESWLTSVLKWDFETAWTISGSSGWPVLKSMDEPTNTLEIAPSTLDFTVSGETKPVTVTSNVNWTTNKDAAWITVSPASGNSDGTINVKTAANTTTTQRTGSVTVSGGGIDRTVSITQAAYVPPVNTLTVSPATLDFTASGETKSVTITSNVNWITSEYVEWITITPVLGSNNGIISITVAANTTTSQRTGTVTVYSSGISIGITRTIAITQAAPAPTLTVSDTDVEIAADGGLQYITLQSNTSWTAVSSDAWVSLLPASGINNGMISIVVAANSTENTRTATVTIAGGGLTRTVTVTQESNTVGNAAVGVTDVYYFDSRLYVNTPVAERVTIYSLDGIQMYQSQKQPGIATFDLRSLPRGVMIVRGDSGWVKKEIKQ